MQNQNHKQNTRSSIREQLQKERGALLSRTSGLPQHPSAWQGDGVDHINVNTSGETQVGRWISPRNSFKFNHPVLGTFRSVENFSMFLRAAEFDDSLRKAEDFVKARNYVRSNLGGFKKNVRHLRALTLHAIYFRVLNNPLLMQLLIESSLPFDSYIVQRDTGVPQRFDGIFWLLDAYAEIRAALKERRSPNLAKFVDRQQGQNLNDIDIYEEILGDLTGNYTGNSAEVISAFEKRSWEAFDKYVEIGKKRAERAERQANKKQDNGIFEIEDVLGAEAAEAEAAAAQVSEEVIDNTVASIDTPTAQDTEVVEAVQDTSVPAEEVEEVGYPTEACEEVVVEEQNAALNQFNDDDNMVPAVA